MTWFLKFKLAQDENLLIAVLFSLWSCDILLGWELHFQDFIARLSLYGPSREGWEEKDWGVMKPCAGVYFPSWGEIDWSFNYIVYWVWLICNYFLVSKTNSLWSFNLVIPIRNMSNGHGFGGHGKGIQGNTLLNISNFVIEMGFVMVVN